jgi:hypothetical protein
LSSKRSRRRRMNEKCHSEVLWVPDEKGEAEMVLEYEWCWRHRRQDQST